MKKKILSWILAATLILPSTVMAAEEEQTEVSGEQRKATIMVLSITGNEMTYIELDTDLEEESEAESEGLPEEEVPGEEPEPESGVEDMMPGGGAGGPGGGNMQDMLEAIQENGGDMSSMQDMIESFAGGGGENPDAGEEMPEQPENGADDAAEDGEETGGPGGGPGGGNMQDMLEAIQENGGDMSSMQDMIESFAGGGGENPDAGEEMPEQPENGADDAAEDGEETGGPGGGFGGGPGGGNMQDMLEAIQENGGDMSSMQDMIESFQENGGGFGGGEMPQMDDAAESGEGFAAMAGANTVYLQVGLTVHADGKEKTFSILEAGDELEALFETDDDGNEIITEMWLLDTD